MPSANVPFCNRDNPRRKAPLPPSQRACHEGCSVRVGGVKEPRPSEGVALPSEGHALSPQKGPIMNPAAATVASLAPIASLHRFDAYRLALAFRSHVVRWLPLKRAELSDQLDRASLSIALNIAEGAGRVGRDQSRHYAIARGSAFECLAVLDLLALETAPASSHEARVVLHRLMAVLTALTRR